MALLKHFFVLSFIVSGAVSAVTYKNQVLAQVGTEIITHRQLELQYYLDNLAEYKVEKVNRNKVAWSKLQFLLEGAVMRKLVLQHILDQAETKKLLERIKKNKSKELVYPAELLKEYSSTQEEIRQILLEIKMVELYLKQRMRLQKKQNENIDQEKAMSIWLKQLKFKYTVNVFKYVP